VNVSARLGSSSQSAKLVPNPANRTVPEAEPACGIAEGTGAYVGEGSLAGVETFVRGEQSRADARRREGSPRMTTPPRGDGVDIVDEGGRVEGGNQLVVIYWNVAGIPKSGIDQFLSDLEDDVKWDILILLEFSVARSETHTTGMRENGHFVSAQPYSEGRRAGAIVFHKRLGIRHMDLVSHGRAFGGDFSWGGWKIRVIGGHADAGGGIGDPTSAALSTWNSWSIARHTTTSLSWERIRKSR
jgi:hypothetical protein